MLVMTAKPDFKKLALILGILILSIAALCFLLREGKAETAQTSAVSANDQRVQYLTELGWQVDASPTETMQVRIPQGENEVFDRYNALQLTQGFDLSRLAGKTVMRYVYRVNNFPDAAEPVYATLLVYKNKVVGGDITDTSAKGKVLPLSPKATDQ